MASGITTWAAGIRYRMANDPGRQDLDDHILCNGFLFLDEYLEDILLGARTEPIIELTKTPGRRKDASKKARAATAVTVKMTPLQFNSLDKENISIAKSPVIAKNAPTLFQKALLKASDENRSHDVEDPPPSFPSAVHAEARSPFGLVVENRLIREDEEQEEEAVKVLVTPPLARVASSIRSEEAPQPLLPSPSIKSPSNAELDDPGRSQEATMHTGIDLSIIAEGNEDDMSRVSFSTSRLNQPIIRDKEIIYDVPEYPGEPDGPMTKLALAYNPIADDDDDTQAFRTPYDRSFNDSEPTSTASSFPIDPYARDYETHELRHLVAEELPEPMKQSPLPHSPPAQPLTRKASVPVFPSLPAPSPLRKSTRESSVGGPLAGNIRTSAATGNGGGTRTSWLNKARDVTAKHTSVVSGIKRKSAELTGEAGPSTLAEGYVRANKVPKTNAEGGVPAALADAERPQGKATIQPFKPVLPTKTRDQPVVAVAPVATPDGNSEGMMNILKRTVEGLGARVGKSMGKSLGGTAATAAAAEAKAAAEARLAQREAKGSDGSRQGRLSVSDLVGVYDSGKGKGKESAPVEPRGDRLPSPATERLSQSRTSISTTPPDSPPVTRKSAPSVPLTVPSQTIPKFTVQRHAPQEQSFVLPESQPSTQSTYMSSVFDDHSAWPQSSFATEDTASQGFSQPETQAKDSEHARDHPALDLSKEVGWAQSQTNISVIKNETTSLTKGPDPYLSELKFAQDDTYDRVPGAFNAEDEDMDLGNDAYTGADVESESEAQTGMERSTSSPSSDYGSSQDKAGPSQPSSQNGFVAQASTLFSKVMGASVGSALGGSKRGKAEPVKSIQLAAVAAKKQQEEADRKAARLREMDKRRAAIASKKAEQETADKGKTQGERRKREREEPPEKKTTRATVKKVEEEIVKKRKVVVEIEKKPESKKPSSKDKKDLGGSRIGKPALSASQSQNTLSKSFKQPGLPASVLQSTVKLVGSSQGDLKSTATLPKAGSSHSKDKQVAQDLEDVRQPSQALHAQMQARVQAQLLQARQEEHPIPSESIELPDINSEYSNSDDEDRPRTFDPPDWAQSPVLAAALQSQSRMNPDDIFGPVRPLRMEEIFPTRQSRFRARTSSANWTGTDELTPKEQMDYAQRMGYLD